jgi:uncharacterized protein (DUF2336 family)
MAGILAKADVERLLNNPSASSRADTVAKVATAYGSSALTTAEREIAADIFRVLTRDAAERVRLALAEHLAECQDLPHDVALALARDVEAVALPVLERSVVLTDDDLIEIIRTGSAGKQIAIAGRKVVREAVADALVETRNAAAVARLVGNPGAVLRDETLRAVLENHGDDQRIQEPMVAREKLPAAVLERLVAQAADSLQEHLVSRHDLAPASASDLVLRIRERATAGLLAGTPAIEAERLARQLNQSGRLTASLILRTLCLGDLQFVEAAFAALAGISTHNARLLIHDPGGLGLSSIYARSGLPAALLPAFRVAIQVATETPFDGGEHDRERHRRRTLERILTQFEAIGAEDLDYLLAKMQEGAASEAA